MGKKTKQVLQSELCQRKKKKGEGGEKNATILRDRQQLKLLVYIRPPNILFKITFDKNVFC